MPIDIKAPIGIFDSGIGGLTVAQALVDLLPYENVIYFGDTAHLPYGDKSTAAIQAYSIKICNFLLEQNCKVILIACNSASAAAYELVREYVGSKAQVFDVIQPIVTLLARHYAHKRIGLIGTRQTVLSEVYKKKVEAQAKGIQLLSLATPLLAPMIEEGFFNKNISKAIIQEYLSHPTLQGIEALVLACTHYPLIKPDIEAYYEGKVTIIDNAHLAAQQVKSWLENENLAQNLHTQAYQRFYVSDYTITFEQTAKLFFGKNIHLAHYPLWE